MRTRPDYIGTVAWQREQWDLYAAWPRHPFDAADEGIDVRPPHTAAWFGQYLRYRVHDGRLVLDSARLCVPGWGAPPLLFGRMPAPDPAACLIGHWYSDLDRPMAYTGCLVVVQGEAGYVEERVPGRQFDRIWALRFAGGALVRSADFGDFAAFWDIASRQDRPRRRTLWDTVYTRELFVAFVAAGLGTPRQPASRGAWLRDRLALRALARRGP